MLKKITDKARGFTLIELLVVIAIIGVLASIVLASLNSARRKSRDARRITDVKQIQLALELYFDAQGTPSYPTATATCDGTANARGLEKLATGGHMPSVPRDPSSSTNCYAYTTAGTTYYHLGATLEDKLNTALNGDKDCDSTVTTGNTCPAGTTAYGPAGTPFNGEDTGGGNDCVGAGTAGMCYDVVP